MALLEDTVVLDVTQVWAGPLASMHLADMGAEVIKIERPGRGDLVRHVPPFVDGMSGYFATVNRNKESVTLDLSSARGREIFMEFVSEADVLLENQKPGTMERFDLDYEHVRSVNEDIVYCSVKGFAGGSVYEDHPVYDIVIQAMGGAMSITGQEDGPPLPSKVPIGDISAGMFASQAVLGALYARDVNGAGGEYIEIPMMNTMTAFLGSRATSSIMKGEPYPRLGSEHTDYVPYKCFETADSYLVVAIGSDEHWERYCRVVGREDLLEDDRFADLESRLAHKDELYDILDPLMQRRPTEDWWETFRAADLPAGPVWDTLEIWEDEYAREQELLEDLAEDPTSDSIPVVRYPANLRSGGVASGSPPPRLGADTEANLRGLGYTREEIEAFRSDGVV